MRNKSMLLSLVAFFSGLATSIAVTRALEEPSAEPVEIAQVSVLVAAADIDAGEPFASQNVKLVECPGNQLPPDCIHEFNDLKSFSASRRLETDEPISRSDLQRVLVKTEPASHPVGRSIQLQVVMDPAAAGITAGKRVQVTIMHNDRNEQLAGSRMVLRSAVVQSIDVGTAEVSPKSDSSLISRDVSLLVSDAEASLLLLAQELGKLQILPSDLQESSHPADAVICTVADLMAFAMSGKQDSPQPSVLPVDDSPPPAIDVKPQAPPTTVSPPVVKDVNILGQVQQPAQHRAGGLARVVIPGSKGFPAQAAAQERRVQLTVSDYQPDSEGTPTSPANLESLRE